MDLHYKQAGAGPPILLILLIRRRCRDLGGDLSPALGRSSRDRVRSPRLSALGASAL